MWYLAISYVWFLAPVMIATLILFKVAGFLGAGIEALPLGKRLELRPASTRTPPVSGTGSIKS